MAENNDQERSLPASQRRLERAREEGRTARSRELVTCLVLLSGGLALAASAPQLARDLRRLLVRALEFGQHAAFSPSAPVERLAALSGEALLLTVPVFAALALAALIGSVAVGGWVFSPKAFGLDFARISPARGLSNLFSINSLAELCKALAKAALVSAVGWLVFQLTRAELIAAARAPVEHAAAGMAEILIVGFLVLAASLVLIAAFDVPFVLWRNARDLRMTREEMRQETRESEGDPQIRMRVRSLQREMARKRMMAEVPKADVVVTNPTHFAVALAYRDGMRAPRVVAKGSDLIALRIRELAAAAHVPLLEAPMLARALYRHAPLGAAIPPGLYDAVAQVLAWVFQLRRSEQSGQSPPPAPERLEVPQEFTAYEASA